MDFVTHTYALPLRVPFRGLTTRSGLLVQQGDRWAEFAPFADYDTAAAALWMQATIESLEEEPPPLFRSRVPVNTTIPAVAPSAARTLVERSGCTTAKVKVGDAADEARVEAVRDALGPAGRIRLDVNGAWDVERAAKRIRSLGRYDLEYVEQPVATVDEMAALRRQVDVPLAADESIRRGDPLDVKRLQAADLVVLKAHPLGGIRRALSLYEALELPAVVSSALETSVGMAVNVLLAAALPELPYACGLGTVTLFTHDVTRSPLVPVDGHVDVRSIDVDRDALARAQAPDDEATRLRARFDTVWEAV